MGGADCCLEVKADLACQIYKGAMHDERGQAAGCVSLLVGCKVVIQFLPVVTAACGICDELMAQGT